MYILHVFVLYLFSKTNLNNRVPSSKWNVYNPYENDVTGWIMKEYFSIFTFQSQKLLYIHQCLLLHVSVCNQNPSTAWNHHPSSFFIHPSFILQLLSFSACLIFNSVSTIQWCELTLRQIYSKYWCIFL